MSTLAATNLKNASGAVINLSLDAAGNADCGGTLAMTSSFLRNRIINGDMRIDQRNAGATITPSVGGQLTYCLDRWCVLGTQGSKFSVQQVTTTSPVGFTHALKVTSASAYAVISSDIFTVEQRIEGPNFSDAAWGTASAQAITMSFWVRSSLTGTFAGNVANDGRTRSYPFTYTVNAIDTWEYKTVTIPGDTTGTWLTTTADTGLRACFGLGVGSDRAGTANTWAGGDYRTVSGAVSIVGTSAATWHVTGVQVEIGSADTPFERRLHGQEMELCQRYYYKLANDTGTTTALTVGAGVCVTTTTARISLQFPVPLRIPVATFEQSGTATDFRVFTTVATVCSAVPSLATDSSTKSASVIFTVASGLTAGQGAIVYSNAAGSYLAWSAEL